VDNFLAFRAVAGRLEVNHREGNPVSEPDDIPNRVTRLEGEMREVRVLAVGADEDVSNVQEALRAHTNVLNALRQTQLEHFSELRQTQLEHFSELRQTQREQGREIKVLRATQLEHGKDTSHLRTTQLEHGRTLAEHGQVLGRVDERIERVDAGIAELLNRRRGESGEG
jgi:chromosome segregation ATPase